MFIFNFGSLFFNNSFRMAGHAADGAVTVCDLRIGLFDRQKKRLRQNDREWLQGTVIGRARLAGAVVGPLTEVPRVRGRPSILLAAENRQPGGESAAQLSLPCGSDRRGKVGLHLRSARGLAAMPAQRRFRGTKRLS